MPGRLIGAIPAAGLATRLQPRVGSKELIPVGGRPVLDYLLERLQRARCDEIRLVTRAEKRDVVDHGARRGLKVILGRPASVAESLALALADLEPDDVVLFGFPDSLWEPADGFVQLAAALDSRVGVALGVFRCTELERSDVVTMGQDGFVLQIQVKPAHPRSNLVWGCAAATAGVLDGLRNHAEPGELFDALARDHLVRGLRFPGEFVDIGTPEAVTRLESRT